MDRGKISVPRRDFKVRGRGSTKVQTREEMRRASESRSVSVAAGVNAINSGMVSSAPATVPIVPTVTPKAPAPQTLSPVQKPVPAAVVPKVTPKPALEPQKPAANLKSLNDPFKTAPAKPVAEVGRKTAPITSSMHTSRGVYIDTVKKPTLSANSRVSIAPPEDNRPDPVEMKKKFAESLGGALNTVEVAPEKDAADDIVDRFEEEILEEVKPIVKENKNDQPKSKKKKKFLFF